MTSLTQSISSDDSESTLDSYPPQADGSYDSAHKKLDLAG